MMWLIMATYVALRCYVAKHSTVTKVMGLDKKAD